MNEVRLKYQSFNSEKLSDKLTQKQANLNQKIKELESFIEDSPKPIDYKHQVTTLGKDARLSRTQIAELRSRTIKNFITFIFALLLFGAVTYLLYLTL